MKHSKAQVDTVLLLGTLILIAIVLIIGYAKIMSPLLEKRPQFLGISLGLDTMSAYAAPESINLNFTATTTQDTVTFLDKTRLVIDIVFGQHKYRFNVYGDTTPSIKSDYENADVTFNGGGAAYNKLHKLNIQKVWNNLERSYTLIFDKIK